MKGRFIRLSKVGDEYFGGDADTMRQFVFLHVVDIWVFLPQFTVCMVPEGHLLRPTEPEVAQWPQKRLEGFWPLAGNARAQAITSNSASVCPIKVAPLPDGGFRTGWILNPERTAPRNIRLDVSELWVERSCIDEALARSINSTENASIGPAEGNHLGTREKNNLLRIIAGLAKEAGIDMDPRGKGAVQMEAAVAILGFDGPKEKTIRGVLAQVRGLE